LATKFGTEIRLEENQLYTAVFRIKGQEKVVSFTSKYNPLFSTVRIIRSDFRELFADYSNDSINRLIHDNSKLALELSDVDLEEEGVTFAAKQYVRYKTELDLATDLFLTLTTKSGEESKQLSDMRITRNVQLPYIDSVLEVLRKRLDSWEIQLSGMKAAPTSSIRAGASTFPLNARVSF
jgi:hypothetical protein